MIITSNLTFAYPGNPAIFKNISLTITDGSYVALMGKNGSGKSTFAMLLKGLLNPSSGTVKIDGFSINTEKSRFEIMKRVGLVFQNPENTIISTTVERELAFGLENMGVPADEMKERVEDALRCFNLESHRHSNPSNLSGGEKQRLALAAVMIMRPSHLILDEPTSLLDPWSREHILQIIHSSVLKGATIIHITPFATEALHADRMIVLDETGIYCDGTPGEVLPRTKGLRSVFTGYNASLHGGDSEEYTHNTNIRHSNSDTFSGKSNCSLSISLETVTHWYDKGTPFENRALIDIALSLYRGSSTGLIGPIGSGKTTLLEIAAGVTVPTLGYVKEYSEMIRAMAFQFPEDHLFGDTVESYVAFGPKNIGVPENKFHEIVSFAIESVGLEPDIYRNRDPFTLSGGEKRRIALAGVFAMKPGLLILDEPTAGLDGEGVEIILASLKNYVNNGGTLLFSTHDLTSVLSLADYAVVLSKGRIDISGTVHEVFTQSKWITSLEFKSPTPDKTD